MCTYTVHCIVLGRVFRKRIVSHFTLFLHSLFSTDIFFSISFY